MRFNAKKGKVGRELTRSEQQSCENLDLRQNIVARSFFEKGEAEARKLINSQLRTREDGRRPISGQ